MITCWHIRSVQNRVTVRSNQGDYFSNTLAIFIRV
jgi:hypothetical protein